MRLERRLAQGEKPPADCEGAVSEEACAVLQKHPTWTLEAARRVAAGHVVLGLTTAQVQAAWG
ncbi:MAG: hypothetical protein H6706_20860 [Myxococcales bacterium]|nr:hypothetical protein [Myxococcales bacterium]